MRLKDGVIKNFLKGHMAASIMDGFMDIPNPFKKGEHMVITGSASTYYLWHKGLSKDYIYKPPSDLDIILSVPPENEKSTDNISYYQTMMRKAAIDAIHTAQFDHTITMSDRYDTKINAKKTFTPDEIREIIHGSRIKEILDQYQMKDVPIDKPVSASIVVDMMSLNNTIMENKVFYNHPKGEESLLRRETLSASLAFKIARTALKETDAGLQRPGDLVDMFNTMHAAGFEYNPALLRIMAVIWVASQVPSVGFDFRGHGFDKIRQGVPKFRDDLREHYNFCTSAEATKRVLEAWDSIAYEIFPEARKSDKFLTPSEENFVLNFLMPLSGSPRESIDTGLLKDTPEKRAAFEKHPEMEENIKSNSFLHQRVTFRQIAPREIEI